MSFIFLLMYLFCTIIRPQDWVPLFYEKPVVDIISIGTILTILFERLAGGSLKLAKVPQNRLMVGLLISVVMSHLMHTYFEGLWISFNLFLIPFILYFVNLNGINSEGKMKITIWFIVAMVFVLVFQGIDQLANGVGWGGQELTFDPQRVEYRINWIGIFNDPNDLALLFVIAVGIVIAFLFGKSNFVVKLITIPVLGYLFYGIYLTNSRGGLLALMTTLFFYSIRRTKKFMIGGIIGGLLCLGVVALGPTRAGLISADEDSAYNRLDLWYAGILMMKSNPLFGVGHNMFTEDLPQTAHNSFILAGAELGMLGLFFWVGLIYASFKCLSLVQVKNESLRTYSMGLQSGLIGFCAAAFFLSRTYVILPYLLFALSGAMYEISKKKDPSIQLEFNRYDVRNIIFLSVGIILLAYILIKIGLR